MSRIDSVWAGLALGLLAGGGYLACVDLVATGAARWVLEFLLPLHFIQPPFEINDFDPDNTAFQVCVTSLSGFALGWLLATIWNDFADRRATALFRKARR